jgi:hypothetical protein
LNLTDARYQQYLKEIPSDSVTFSWGLKRDSYRSHAFLIDSQPTKYILCSIWILS